MHPNNILPFLLSLSTAASAAAIPTDNGPAGQLNQLSTNPLKGNTDGQGLPVVGSLSNLGGLNGAGALPGVNTQGSASSDDEKHAIQNADPSHAGLAHAQDRYAAPPAIPSHPDSGKEGEDSGDYKKDGHDSDSDDEDDYDSDSKSDSDDDEDKEHPFHLGHGLPVPGSKDDDSHPSNQLPAPVNPGSVLGKPEDKPEGQVEGSSSNQLPGAVNPASTLGKPEGQGSGSPLNQLPGAVNPASTLGKPEDKPEGQADGSSAHPLPTYGKEESAPSNQLPGAVNPASTLGKPEGKPEGQVDGSSSNQLPGAKQLPGANQLPGTNQLPAPINPDSVIPKPQGQADGSSAHQLPAPVDPTSILNKPYGKEEGAPSNQLPGAINPASTLGKPEGKPEGQVDGSSAHQLPGSNQLPAPVDPTSILGKPNGQADGQAPKGYAAPPSDDSHSHRRGLPIDSLNQGLPLPSNQDDKSYGYGQDESSNKLPFNPADIEKLNPAGEVSGVPGLPQKGQGAGGLDSLTGAADPKTLTSGLGNVRPDEFSETPKNALNNFGKIVPGVGNGVGQGGYKRDTTAALAGLPLAEVPSQFLQVGNVVQPGQASSPEEMFVPANMNSQFPKKGKRAVGFSA